MHKKTDENRAIEVEKETVDEARLKRKLDKASLKKTAVKQQNNSLMATVPTEPTATSLMATMTTAQGTPQTKEPTDNVPSGTVTATTPLESSLGRRQALCPMAPTSTLVAAIRMCSATLHAVHSASTTRHAAPEDVSHGEPSAPQNPSNAPPTTTDPTPQANM